MEQHMAAGLSRRMRSALSDVMPTPCVAQRGPTGSIFSRWTGDQRCSQLWTARKGNSAVEGFPSRDGRANLTLGDRPPGHVSDTPRRESGVGQAVFSAPAKARLAFRNHSTSARMPMTI